MKNSKLRIIVTGLIGQHPALGGVAWDYLQYPLGLRLLGHDVYYFEDSGEWPYTLYGGSSGSDWVAKDCDRNVAHLKSVMTRIGLEDRWAYRFPLRSSWHGLSDTTREEVLRTTDLLINVSGTVEHPDAYRSVGRMVYIDSDPIFTQVKIAKGDQAFCRRVAAHDVHFSFGDSLCEGMIQTPYVWIPTRQPIVLREWRPLDTRRDVITTVMSWTSYRPLAHLGVTYGQKDAEFMKFLGLPSRMQTTPLEIALGNTEHVNWLTANAELTPSLQKILHDKPQLSATDLLQLTGWRVVDAYDRCGSLDSYRDYIRTSKAEWSVAKNGYVRGSAGWFSCRSACYLACGRPVVVQNTGFDRTLPVGEGLLTFHTVDEAVASLLEVLGNYARHCATAAQIASNYFEAEKVLADLLELSYSSTSSPTSSKASGHPERKVV